MNLQDQSSAVVKATYLFDHDKVCTFIDVNLIINANNQPLRFRGESDI